MIRQWLNDPIIIAGLLKEDTLLHMPEKTWNDFEQIAKDKKVYVFGAGRFAQNYLSLLEEKASIQGFLDNDIKKDGSKIGNHIVKHTSFLDTIENKDNIVILIMSTIYTQLIYEQLQKMGMVHIYSFFDMEKKTASKVELLDKCRTLLNDCKIKDNKILVKINPAGKYICHAQAIIEKLLTMNKELEIVWMCDDKSGFPDGIRVVENSQKNMLIELADAKIFISNDVLHFGTPKKEGQVFINTWHGSIALKRIGKYLRSEHAQELEIMHVDSFSRHTDYFISNGKWCTQMYRDTFNFSGEILEYGSARLDSLFEEQPEYEHKTKSKFGIDDKDFVLLYAPTFREKAGKDRSGILSFDVEKVKTALEKRWGGKWHIIVKHHPGISAKLNVSELLPGCIVANPTMNIYELMRITDLLITDYSSTMFEAGFLGKKVLLFANDVQDYIDNERGMYFDYYSLPYAIAESEQQLVDNICQFDEAAYDEKVKRFNEKELGIIEDGNATERTVRLILDVIEGR